MDWYRDDARLSEALTRMMFFEDFVQGARILEVGPPSQSLASFLLELGAKKVVCALEDESQVDPLRATIDVPAVDFRAIRRGQLPGDDGAFDLVLDFTLPAALARGDTFRLTDVARVLDNNGFAIASLRNPDILGLPGLYGQMLPQGEEVPYPERLTFRGFGEALQENFENIDVYFQSVLLGCFFGNFDADPKEDGISPHTGLMGEEPEPASHYLFTFGNQVPEIDEISLVQLPLDELLRVRNERDEVETVFLKEKLVEVEQKNEEQQAATHQLVVATEALQKEHQSLKEEKEALEKRFDEVKMQKQAVELNAQKGQSELAYELKETKNKVFVQEKALVDLGHRVPQLRAHVDDLVIQLEERLEERDELQKGQGELAYELKETKNKVFVQEKALVDLGHRVPQLRAHVDDLVTQLEERLEERDELMIVLEQSHVALLARDAQLKVMKTAFDDVKGKLKEKEEALHGAKSSTEQQRAAIEGWRATLAQSADEINELKDALKKAESDLDRLDLTAKQRLAMVAQELERTRNAFAEHQKKEAENATAYKSIAAALEKAKEDERNLVEALDDERVRANEAENAWAQSEEQVEVLLQNAQAQEQKLKKELSQKAELIAQKVLELEEELDKKSARVVVLEEERKEHEGQLNKLAQGVKDLVQERESLERSKDAAEGAVQKIMAAAKEKEERQNTLLEEKERLLEEKEALLQKNERRLEELQVASTDAQEHLAHARAEDSERLLILEEERAKLAAELKTIQEKSKASLSSLEKRSKELGQARDAFAEVAAQRDTLQHVLTQRDRELLEAKEEMELCYAEVERLEEADTQKTGALVDLEERLRDRAKDFAKQKSKSDALIAEIKIKIKKSEEELVQAKKDFDDELSAHLQTQSTLEKIKIELSELKEEAKGLQEKWHEEQKKREEVHADVARLTTENAALLMLQSQIELLQETLVEAQHALVQERARGDLFSQQLKEAQEAFDKEKFVSARLRDELSEVKSQIAQERVIRSESFEAVEKNLELAMKSCAEQEKKVENAQSEITELSKTIAKEEKEKLALLSIRHEVDEENKRLAERLNEECARTVELENSLVRLEKKSVQLADDLLSMEQMATEFQAELQAEKKRLVEQKQFQVEEKKTFTAQVFGLQTQVEKSAAEALACLEKEKELQKENAALVALVEAKALAEVEAKSLLEKQQGELQRWEEKEKSFALREKELKEEGMLFSEQADEAEAEKVVFLEKLRRVEKEQEEAAQKWSQERNTFLEQEKELQEAVKILALKVKEEEAAKENFWAELAAEKEKQTTAREEWNHKLLQMAEQRNVLEDSITAAKEAAVEEKNAEILGVVAALELEKQARSEVEHALLQAKKEMAEDHDALVHNLHSMEESLLQTMERHREEAEKEVHKLEEESQTFSELAELAEEENARLRKEMDTFRTEREALKASLDKERAAQQEAALTLVAERDGLQNAYSGLEARLRELEAQLQEKTECMTEAEVALISAQQERDESLVQLDKSLETIRVVQSSFDEERIIAKKMEAELQDLRAEKQDIELTAHKAGDALEQMRLELDSLRKDRELRMGELEARTLSLAASEENARAAEETIIRERAEHEQEVKNLRAALEENDFEAELQRSAADLAEKEALLENARANADDLEARLSTVQEAREGALQMLAEQKQWMEDLEIQVTRLESELRVAKVAEKEKTAAWAERGEMLADEQVARKEAQDAASRSLDELANLEGEMASLKEEVSAAKKEAEILDEEHEKTASLLEEQQSITANVQERLAEAEREQKHVEEKLSMLNSENESLRTQLMGQEHLVSENNETKRRLEAELEALQMEFAQAVQAADARRIEIEKNEANSNAVTDEMDAFRSAQAALEAKLAFEVEQKIALERNGESLRLALQEKEAQLQVVQSAKNVVDAEKAHLEQEIQEQMDNFAHEQREMQRALQSELQSAAVVDEVELDKMREQLKVLRDALSDAELKSARMEWQMLQEQEEVASDDEVVRELSSLKTKLQAKEAEILDKAERIHRLTERLVRLEH